MSPKKNKLSRAQTRARLRRGKRRSSSRGWTLATVAIVAIGAGAIFLAYGGGDSETSPEIGEHIHGYLGVNVCGAWLPNAPEYESPDGIHSHGDGLLHIHPATSAAAGDNATVARFFEDNENADWALSSDSMTLWDGVEYTNGQECVDGEYAGQEAEIEWAVGQVGEPWDGTPRTGDPADYHPEDGDIVAIAFLPPGVPVPEPPGAEAALGAPTDVPAGSSDAPDHSDP